MGHSIRQYYKQICRRIHRLPLDRKTLKYLHLYCKGKFATPLKKAQYQHSPIDKNLHERGISILDEVLVNENYESLDIVLDFIYKDTRLQPSWITDFMKFKYSAFKPYWPQVHLFNELTHNPEHSKIYKENLEKEKDADLSLLDYFGISPEPIDLDLKPLRSPVGDKPSPVVVILLEIKKLHLFLFKNQEKLTHLKIQPLEITYPTNRFALPIHVTQRDRLLKEKINYAKKLTQEFRPICEESLNHLIKFAIYKPGNKEPSNTYKINEKFYRYMIRKHKMESTRLSPLSRRHLRSKKLIPDDNNIRKYMREYVRRQFYYDSNLNTHKMSWMQNFYENEKRVVPDIEIRSLSLRNHLSSKTI